MSNEKLEDVVHSMTPVLQPTHELLFKAASIVEEAGDHSLCEALRIRAGVMRSLYRRSIREVRTDLLTLKVVGLVDIPMHERK